MKTTICVWSLAVPLGTLAISACASHDSPSPETTTNGAYPMGGLPSYGYSGNASYGGYSAFAGQPWGGDDGAAGGSTFPTTTSTGGLASVSSGGTNQAMTGTGGTNAGGRSSGVGGASTGGRSSGVGGTNTGGTGVVSGSSGTGGRSTTGGASATGGSLGTGGASATGGASPTGGASAFNWGTATYQPTGGSSVNHQGHNTGAACLASCHAHNFQAGGTIYQANGTTTAGNVQIGIIMNGALFTGYSGTQGNFFLPISGTLNWATAQIAIRTATGTAIHPATSGISGNCNSCHNSANRIVVP